MKFSDSTLKEVKHLQELTSNRLLKFYQRELGKERVALAITRNKLRELQSGKDSGLKIIFKAGTTNKERNNE